MKSRGTARSGAASIATVLAVAAGLLAGTVATAVATPHTATASAAHATVVAPERHDFGTDGIGDVVTMDTAGRLAIQPGDGQGGIDSAHKALAGGWPTTSYPIPFGDLTGDGCNDLLVRTLQGELVRYSGSCGGAITPNSPHELLTIGLASVTVLTSPGDVTGDGLPDLISRDSAGVLWLYAGKDNGRLADRVDLVAGQGKYTRIVGAGDISGDGLGDLVAVDEYGTVWRLLANGTGGFDPRQQIGSGFNSYNIFAVPGDLTGDGRPDLVARDTAGNLWRWTGTSAGLFTGRTLIATDWSGYLYLT